LAVTVNPLPQLPPRWEHMVVCLRWPQSIQKSQKSTALPAVNNFQ
jgi:hypothetical protein